MLAIILCLFRFVRLLGFGHQTVAIENLALLRQLAAYKRKRRRSMITQWDRLFWVGLARFWGSWRDALVFVQARHRGPLAAGTFSQILGSPVTAQWRSSRKTCRCQRNSQPDKKDGRRQSAMASSENSWRIEDARDHNIGANRLTCSAHCSTPAFSDVEDVSPEPFGPDCIC
jgi:hypothetical protein